MKGFQLGGPRSLGRVEHLQAASMSIPLARTGRNAKPRSICGLITQQWQLTNTPASECLTRSFSLWTRGTSVHFRDMSSTLSRQPHTLKRENARYASRHLMTENNYERYLVCTCSTNIASMSGSISGAPAQCAELTSSPKKLSS